MKTQAQILPLKTPILTSMNIPRNTRVKRVTFSEKVEVKVFSDEDKFEEKERSSDLLLLDLTDRDNEVLSLSPLITPYENSSTDTSS